MGLLRRGGFLSAVALVVFGGLLAASPASAAPATVTIDGITYTADDENVGAGASATGFSGSGAVTIPDTVDIDGVTYDVTAIGYQAFKNTGITGATIGNNVTEIEPEAFADNAGMTSLDLGTSVQQIRGGSFQYGSLSSVTIPDSVTIVGSYAFAGNDISSLTLGNSLESIGYSAFRNNEFSDLVIPDSVTSIGGWAFIGSRIESLDLGTSVETIGEGAFNSNRLTAVTIPAPVTDIGGFAFRSNNLLGSVVFDGAAPTVSPASDSLPTFPDTTTLTYLWAHDQANGGGFTTPQWQGYATEVLRDAFTVNFDLQGLGSAAPADQNVLDGAQATAPVPEPSDDEWVFSGWSTDVGGTEVFSFDTPITGDTVLYAVWTEFPDAEEPGDTDDTDTGEGAGGGSDQDGTEENAAATGAGVLPNTGGPAGGILLAALALLGLGIALQRRRA